MLTAEFFRRSLGLDAIHHHIADTHALSNDFCTPEGVAEIAAEYRDVLMRIARVTGVELNVHLSSEFDTTDTYKALLSEIHTGKGEYVDRELTDMLWYRRQHGVSLKLGWLIQAIKSEQGFDERLYDEAFREHCDGGMSFAYVQPGRTFDQRRMKASPYIAIPGERRIVFKPDTNARAVYEEAVEVWGDKKLGGAVNHLNAVLRLWDKISKTPAPRTGDVIDRVQAIIDLVFEN
ncbi:hypothetical protein CO174_01560 [Candidatus Uhrbacteria bacterium CG_4_9_14_3_um_filter_50_9]|uniref:Uncharacterized protein n=1 Tax=Candidatus Uhrbacteria bacterium CG_4_9_14_3_um_filter_50_9 TaxID=1975035 RepID=A0A2M7XD69_9BACT|nr:MAG: hypothetical protein CO174_01560 [Candidatus Uhrbacteria bacterium CG_4_9_14_3_um_filter_50_9]